MGRGPPGTTRSRPQNAGAVSPGGAVGAARTPELLVVGAAVAAAPAAPKSVSNMAPSWSASAASTSACPDAGAVPSPQAASPATAAAIMRWIAFRICHLSSELLTVDLDSERWGRRGGDIVKARARCNSPAHAICSHWTFAEEQTMRAVLLASLAASILATLPPAALQAQRRKVPKRPHLEGADTNLAPASYEFGMRALARDPQKAADAFYWATRL